MSVSLGSSFASKISLEKNRSVDMFNAKYKRNCNILHTQPLRGLKLQALNSSLDIIVDRIKYEDWIPLLKTISTDKNLHFLTLRSRHCQGKIILEHINTEKEAREYKKGAVLFTKYMLTKVVEAFASCLIHSKNLMCLQFQCIPLEAEAMDILAQAVSKTNCLQHLVLQNCNVGDEGCKLLFRALRNQPTVRTLDLSNCHITEQGAYYIAELIKAQEIARLGECWKHSLRYREVSHDIISGLRRIILNNNPNIGDKGLKFIILVLCDDFWIKALDMQNCGITDLGCMTIMNLINMNNKIVVFDVRRNPILDQTKISEIIHQLYSQSTASERAEYGWLKIEPSTPSSSSSSPSTVSSFGSYKSLPYKLCTNTSTEKKHFGFIARNSGCQKKMFCKRTKSVPDRLSSPSMSITTSEGRYYSYLETGQLKC